MIKSGYFRVVSGDCEHYVSYKEYLEWDDAAKKLLREKADDSSISLYCGCCSSNSLPLIITSNNVIRVANNKLQELHMDSCPKSVFYSQWHSQLQNGVFENENAEVVFNLSLPPLFKSSSNSSSSSSGTGTGSPREKKMDFLTLAVMLNSLAWEKQTFSVKKSIKISRKEGLPASWNYKSKEDFLRLMFGIANDITCCLKGQYFPLIALCYRRDLFYGCNDFRREWFIFAQVEKISEVKNSRKYQYITVKMPSANSNTKATVRIPTDDFLKMSDVLPCDLPLVLTGFVVRKSFSSPDGASNEWIQLIKGALLPISNIGLIVNSSTEERVASYFAKNHILFLRPYKPLENYGSLIPSFVIERLHDKNIIVDCVDEGEYETRSAFANDNEEFVVLFVKHTDDVDALLDEFFM